MKMTDQEVDEDERAQFIEELHQMIEKSAWAFQNTNQIHFFLLIKLHYIVSLEYDLSRIIKCQIVV